MRSFENFGGENTPNAPPGCAPDAGLLRKHGLHCRSVTMWERGTILREANHYGGAENLNSITSAFFNAVHLLPKDLRFQHGGPKLLLAPGAI